jgi:hypothetical protein
MHDKHFINHIYASNCNPIWPVQSPTEVSLRKDNYDKLLAQKRILSYAYQPTGSGYKVTTSTDAW